jgi:GNAT superfamily N-acetyltransferase
MTAIRPMRDDEFDAWYDACRDAYARDIEESGGVPHDEAQKKAVDDMADLLGDRLATEGHGFFVADVGGEPAGWLWIAERPGMSGRQLWIYEVRVDEAHRGEGLGRALMERAEEEARDRRLPQIGLNVFGGNEVARGLYRSLGYFESAVFMVKRIETE